MSNIDKRALRGAAEKAISEEGETWWNEEQLASDYGLALHKADAKFIAAANPVTVLALLDELEAAQIYAKDRDEENQDLMLTVGRLRVELEASEAELGNALCELLPGVQYMDPPDGASVTPLEQVSRMVADYREQIQAAEKRIAEQRETLLAARSHVMQCARMGDAHANGLLQAIDRAAAGKGE